MEAAKRATGEQNETTAIKKFKEKLNSSEEYFNDETFPANESNDDAHEKCSNIEGAKKYCPTRWEALEKWFTEARSV